MIADKLLILAIPVVLVAAWPFTGPETLNLLIQVGMIAVAIIAALKANAAKVAVNGHLAKLEKEQDKAKSDRDAEFARFLQVTKDAARAEGAEIARQAAEMLAAKVAEGVARDRADAGKVLMPISVAPIMSAAPPSAMAAQPAPAPAVAPAKRIDAAIEELTDAAKETSASAEKTVGLAEKHPR